MWQKTNPIGFRVWITKSWPCEWYAKSKSQSAKFVVEDVKIREFVDDFYKRSWLAKLVIRKTEKDWELIIFTAKPAAILWKDWKKLEIFQSKLKDLVWKEFKVIVKQIKVPEFSAKIMAEFATQQLESRMPYRRVWKTLLQKVMDKWALWIKIQIWWRLWWADMARTEKFNAWRVPLQTLRSDIDYHYTTALTKYGILGVKVWICKWDLYNKWKELKKPFTKNK